MSDGPWQILVVDDDEEFCEQFKAYFVEGLTLDDTDRSIELTITQDFSDAMIHLESKKIDLVILDLRKGTIDLAEPGAHAGNETLAEIKKRRFVPVVFYTGLPTQVQEPTSTVVRVIEKTKGLEDVEAALREIVATGIPAANRAILRHVDHVQRDFMWKFHDVLAPYNNSPDRLSIAFLMARRLAKSLQDTGIEQLARDFGDTSNPLLKSDTSHPMFFYVIPPIDDQVHTGSLYEFEGKYWAVLTNACDLTLFQAEKKINGVKTKVWKRKAEMILLAECLLLTDQDEHAEFKAKPTSEAIKNLIKNNRTGQQSERFFFLPAALHFPDLVVDIQRLKTLTYDEVLAMKCLAIIDSPYLESMIARFTNYYARIGTPNINVDVVIGRLAGAL